MAKRNATTTKRPRRRPSRILPLTAAYVRTRDGWYAAEVLEAKSVYSQGRTLEEARRNLADAIVVMLEEAPHQFFVRRGRAPAHSIREQVFVVVPA